MKNSKKLVLAMAFALVFLMTGLLILIKSRQGLVEPGVRVGEGKVYGITNNVVANTCIQIPAEVLGSISLSNGPVAPQELTDLPPDTTFGRRLFVFPDGFFCQITTILMGTDRSSIHAPQFCLTGQGWNIDKQEAVTLRIAKPDPYDLQAIKLTSSIRSEENGQTVETHSIYVYWFVAKDRLCTGQFDRMWSTIKTLLSTGKLERWAYISYFSMCKPGEEEATYQRLTQVINASLPQFQITTGKTGSAPAPGA